MSHWRLKLSLALNFLVLAILLNSVGTVALQVQRMQGGSAPVAGLLAVCKGLGIVSASFLTICYLTRVGYRITMLLSLGVLTLVCLLLPSVLSLTMLELLFVAVGAGFALMKVSVYATIGLLAKDWHAHVTFMSFIQSLYSGGIVLGYFLFSAFADDANPQSTAWLKVFYIIAALSFVAFLLLLSTNIDESAAQSSALSNWRISLVVVRRLALTRPLMLFAICIFLYVMVEQGVVNLLPTLNHQALHLPARLSIQLSSLLIVAMTCGRFSAGFLLRRLPWFPVLAVGIVAAAVVVMVALALAGPISAQRATGEAGIPLAALIIPLTGFFLAPIYPVLNSAILHTLAPKDQGAMSSLSVIFSALGSAIGTVALGYVFHTKGGAVTFYFSLLPLAALLGSLILFSRMIEKSGYGSK